MNTIQFSMVIFYNDKGEILLQDRRNIGKDAIEWGWFGGRAEGHETPVETAIREIQEEINITLSPEDLVNICRVTTEAIFNNEIKDGNIFCVRWKQDFEKNFRVLEGAGYEWVTPDEMRSRRIYEVQRFHLAIFEQYLKTQNA